MFWQFIYSELWRFSGCIVTDHKLVQMFNFNPGQIDEKKKKKKKLGHIRESGQDVGSLK